MRVFVALDIPASVRDRIAIFAHALQWRAPRARWVPVEGIHITLKFIGETPESQVPAICEALEPVRAPAPAEMNFRGAGFFPDARRPRVFWVGIDTNSMLAELAGEIERRLEPLGIARERRPFRPHLTLARFDRTHGMPRGSDDLRVALAENGPPEFGAATERQFHLYRSLLGPGGARYSRLATFTFAPEAL